MENLGKLTIKQERFSLKLHETGNASEAYRFAYNTSRMKPETINRAAFELSKLPKITARLEQLEEQERRRIQKKFHLTQDKIVQQYMRFAFADARQLFDKDGKLLEISKMPDDIVAAIAGFKEGEIKLVDKKGPLQDLAKMLGMFLEHNMQKKGESSEVNVTNQYQLPDALLQGFPGKGSNDNG